MLVISEKDKNMKDVFRYIINAMVFIVTFMIGMFIIYWILIIIYWVGNITINIKIINLVSFYEIINKDIRIYNIFITSLVDLVVSLLVVYCVNEYIENNL